MFFFRSLSFIKNSSLFCESALVRAICRLCLSALLDVIVTVSQCKCQTTECTQAFILSVTLSVTLFMMFFHDAMCISHSVTLTVTPSVTLTKSLSVSFFHITIYIKHSVSLSTSHETDIIARTQALILSVTLSVTLSMMFFHDAMCMSHSVTPSVTLTESLSVLFFHITIYRHPVSLSTSHEIDIIVYVLFLYS